MVAVVDHAFLVGDGHATDSGNLYQYQLRPSNRILPKHEIVLRLRVGLQIVHDGLAQASIDYSGDLQWGCGRMRRIRALRSGISPDPDIDVAGVAFV